MPGLVWNLLERPVGWGEHGAPRRAGGGTRPGRLHLRGRTSGGAAGGRQHGGCLLLQDGSVRRLQRPHAPHALVVEVVQRRPRTSVALPGSKAMHMWEAM